MSNNTEIFWEISGVSLHTYAWSIETFGGSRYSSAAKRGEDQSLPFTLGRRSVRKSRDSRTLGLQMWITDCLPDGSDDLTMSKEARLHENWNYILTLFDQDELVPLKKRWYQNGEVVSATAMVEVLDPPDPTVRAKNTIGVTFEVFLADPWFYGSPVVESVGTITVQGNKPTEHVLLTMGNGRVTTPDGNWIQYDGAGEVVIDISAGTVKQGETYMNGLVSRNPLFPEWLRLNPGSQAITGTGSITYEPAYK